MTNSERLERAEEEIFRIGEAVDYLSGVRDCEDVIQTLKDRMILLGLEKEKYHRLAEAEDDRDLEALRREYFRAVM